MRRYIFAIPFLATALMAQWTDPHIRVERADGKQHVFDVISSGDVDVLVEFRDPPLCLTSRTAKTAISDYRARFAHFRNDAALILNAGVSRKHAVEPAIRYEYYEAFNGVSLTVPRSAIPLIRQLQYVKSVHLDALVHASSADPAENITKIGADKVWSTRGTRGRGIVIAIIDTGIDYSHPALGGGFGPDFKVIGGYDFVNKDNDPMDDNSHGTHVAGIAAGNSDELVGVAPEASLLAYKVLNDRGSGKQSDVIAAIERTVDPNGDGDLSDHADAANLSLGGPGNPDDAASTAVDNATAAGVVFCIAAGNFGDFHRIESPGTARLAITVGATDNADRIAPFSSRGPNTKNAAIKPDILAPGVAVRSSIPGGKYASFSGTSMATPHVAGVVALVKSLHRDWTPAQIKSAIVNSGSVLIDDIMAQGGGRVDALRSADATLSIEPSSISLGLDPIQQQTWSQSATLHLTNRRSQPISYTVNALAAPGVTLTVVPSSITLPPGGSTDLAVSFNVTNAVVNPSLLSFAIGRSVALTSSGTSRETLRVPWAAVKAARGIVTYDKSFPTAIWIDRTGGRVTQAVRITETELEAFVRPGLYDLLFFWAQVDESLKPGDPVRLSEARLYYLDAQNLNGDTTLPLLASQATNTITFDARNEKGQPVVGSDFSGYASTGRIVFPQGSVVLSLLLPALPIRTWHVGDITEKVLCQELQYDQQKESMYAIQHSPLNGIHGDVTLTAGGSMLKRANASVAIVPAARGDQRVVIVAQPIVPPRDSPFGLTLTRRVDTLLFNISVFLVPDVDPDYSMGVAFVSVTDGASSFTTPVLRMLNGKILATNTAQPPPWIYDGDTFIFGSGLKFPLQTFNLGAVALKPNIFTDFIGQLGEVRLRDRGATTTTVYAADGSVQTRGSRYPTPLDFSQAGAFKIEAVNDGIVVPGIPRRSTVTMTLDSRRADYYGPTLTTMMLFDGKGRIATQLEPNGGGSLLFAAADYVYPPSGGPRTYQPIRAEGTKVWYRYSGSPEWKPLVATQVTEDVGSTSVAGAGILFRTDLAQVANVDRALVDMIFDIEDTSGNMTSYVMEPAFSVESQIRTGRQPGRR